MTTIRKRDFLIGTAAAAAAAMVPFRLGATEPPPLRKRMNLLLITADDLDWSIPGFMGGRAGLMPNLDALAARSHRFLSNRTVAPICMPSREALMTGLLPHRSGGTGFTAIKSGTPTLTSLLQQAGYFAGVVHKSDHMQPYECFQWDYIQQSKDRSTLIQADGARVAIEEARNNGKPFFVNCNSNDPHRPFYGSPGGMKVDHGETGPYKIAREVQPAEVTVPPILEDLPDVRRELSQYWNSAQRLDVSIGNILKVLEESGEADNTAVVFCSDHGMPFPFAKATCYDHGTRVPVLISWPGMGPPRDILAQTTHMDILPSLLEFLGVDVPAGLDGRSWMPLLRGETQEGRDFTVTQVNTLSSGYAYPMRAIQDMRYSLVFSPWARGPLKYRSESMMGLTYNAMAEAAKSDARIAARVEQLVTGYPIGFYDLKSDPGQRINLIDNKRHAARIKYMADQLLAQMEKTGDPELANVRTLLSGGTPVVPQDIERYRLRNGGDG